MAVDEIQKKFERFHAENPHVLETLERLAAEWFVNHSTVGIGMLFEVARWVENVDTGGDAFKLNNNFRSRYVRLMIERRPEWEYSFETRALGTERAAA